MRLLAAALAVYLIVCPSWPKPVNSDDTKVPNIMQSGNEFLEGCKHVEEDPNTESVFMNGVCLGFIKGFTQGATVVEEFHGTPLDSQMMCPAAEVTTIQYIRIVKRYIENHPERAHMATRYLASEALIHAFPCKK
jgi:hypothetical protein